VERLVELGAMRLVQDGEVVALTDPDGNRFTIRPATG
jgi:hypothetical protein